MARATAEPTMRSPSYCFPSPLPSMKPRARRRHDLLPTELRVHQVRPGDVEEAFPGFLRCVGDARREKAHLLESRWTVCAESHADFNLLVLLDARHRAHDLHPSPIGSRFDSIDFVERAPTILGRPQVALLRVEGHAEAVADAIGKDALKVAAHLVSERAETVTVSVVFLFVVDLVLAVVTIVPIVSSAQLQERIVARRAAVVVEAEDHARQVRVIRRRPAKIIVRHRTRQIVLREAAAAIVADDDVQLPIRAETEHAAVVIAPEHRQRRVGHVVPIVLERAQADDVLVEGQRAAIPHETVHAIAEQRHLGGDVRVGAGRALRVVEIHVRRSREPGCRAMPNRPRSLLEFTAKSSTAPVTTPLVTRMTCPDAFSVTRISSGPIKAIAIGWLSPSTTVDTPKLGSTRDWARASRE